MPSLKQFILTFFLCSLSLVTYAGKKDLTKLSYSELKWLFLRNENNNIKKQRYAKAYLCKAIYEHKPVEKAQAFYFLSLLSENQQALRYLDSIIYLTKDLNHSKFLAFAYSAKGHIYKRQLKYDKAIDNYIIAQNFTKENNLDLFYKIKYSIALLRSEELGQVNEGLSLYNECLSYYQNKNIKDPKYANSYQNVLFGLADSYKTLHETNYATYYDSIGYLQSKTTKHHLLNALFILNEGANQIHAKNYTVALDSINKALPTLIFYKDYENMLSAYFYKAKAYNCVGQKALAVKNYIKVDSLYNLTGRMRPELVNGYLYLIAHYKNNNDRVNQLKYFTKYVRIDSILQNNFKDLTKKLRKDYDNPLLIAKEENQISILKKEIKNSFKGIEILTFSLIILSGIGTYQYFSKRSYNPPFYLLTQNQSLKNSIEPLQTEHDEQKIKNKIELTGINEDLVIQIKTKLTHFETTKGFLNPNITSQSLSGSFETNVKYVSKVVNIYKEKTFIQYINDLRIDNAVKSLKEDGKLRKYTIKALAKEFGFNSIESFTNAFYKNTGLKPTFFIKQIEESVQKV